MTRRAPAKRSRPPGAGRRFLAALVAFIAVLIGIPLLLVGCSRVGLDSTHPLPGIGTTDEIKAFFERDLTPTEIAPIAMRGLLIAGWLLWLAMAVSIIASILDATGSGLRSAVPQLAMFAGMGRWIAAGLTAFSSLAPNFVSAASLASPRPFIVSSATPAAAAATVTETPVATGFARVQRGESVETFAQRTLGDPARWTEIWELNRQQPVGHDGETWSVAWKLVAGWDLRLPAGSQAAPAFAPPTGAAPRPGPASSRQNGAERVDEPASRHHVIAGDSYWSIARRQLGDGAPGLQVWDYTQALMEANAARLGYDDPAMLHPGDEVELVANAPLNAAASGDPAAEPTPMQQVTVEAGDSYWAIAAETLGDDATARDVLELTGDLVDLNSPRLGYDVRPMIQPGDVVFLHDPNTIPPPPPALVPPTPAPDPIDVTELVETVTSVDEGRPTAPVESVSETTALATSSTSTTSTVVAAATVGTSASDVDPDRPSRSPIGIGEASLLATGVVALLAAKRRARLRAAEPPARVPLPRPETSATERMLRRLDDSERLLRVDIALRAVASIVAATDHRVVAVRSAPDGAIEVTLSDAVALGEPWSGSGRVWTLPRAVPVDDLATQARSVGAPCIALVPVGVDDQGWDVLLDLEAVGVLAIDADESIADSVVRAIAIGLASCELAEVAHLVGVGIDESVFMGHRQAQVVASLDEGIELAATLVGAAGSARRTTFTLRARHTSGEVWEPAVVLVASAHVVSAAPIVAATLTSRGGVALVAAGPVAGAVWNLRADGPMWTLDPLGIRLLPVGVEAEDVAVLLDAIEGDPLGIEAGPVSTERTVPPSNGHRERELFADCQDSHVAVLEMPVPAFDAVSIHLVDEQRPEAFADRTWEMMVRVMGPVELVDAKGAAAKFERSKTLELLAWMVTHRERPTRAAARTALWHQDVRDATFANVVSEARRALARHVEPPQGDEWVRRTLTDELSLHDLVISDAEIVKARYEAGRARDGQAALDTLKPAVEMIRDLPFSGSAYLWPEIEGLASNLVMLSTNLTAEYARRALAAGDFEGVFWSTASGLRVLPGQEALIALRMRAHADAGDLSGVRLEWESYERVINADPWSDGEPAAKLVTLRKQLLSM